MYATSCLTCSGRGGWNDDLGVGDADILGLDQAAAKLGSFLGEVEQVFAREPQVHLKRDAHRAEV